MTVTKIAHIADSHLRQRQYGNYKRGEDFLAGLLSAINTAKEQGCHAILHSGDLLDSTNPGPAVCIDQLEVVNEELKKKQLPMYVISGNHDKTNPSWWSRFRNIDSGIIGVDNSLFTINGVVTAIGVPFMPDRELREILPQLASADIFMWHGAIAEFAGYATDNAITMKELSDLAKWKLISLGDQHIHKTDKSGESTFFYPGSTELCSVSEDFEKEMYITEWQDRNLISISSATFPTRPKQLFTVETEEDLENCCNSINPKAVVFVKYRRDVQSAAVRLQLAMRDTNILRAVPFASNKKKATDIKTSDIKDVNTFLKDHINELVDKEKAARIESVCIAILDNKLDYVASLDAFIETSLGKINI